jgi:signal transduction histidine kinase
MCGKILIVDDEPDIQGMINLKMRKQIRDGKFNFCFASNGEEAIEKLKTEDDIDILVSDINMPVMDGITLINQIKDEFPDIKSIMVTAYGDMDNIRSAIKNGVQDYLVKPINFDDFEFALERTLRIAKKEKEVKIARQKANEDLEKAKQQLAEAYEKERKLNNLKSNFISMVSREYRNPLSIIQSSADVLKTVMNGNADQTTKKFLSHIELSVKTMSEILDDVLIYEDIDKIALNNEATVCVSCLLPTLIHEFESLTKTKGRIKIESNSEKINIKSDESLLYLILINLISNAAKFSEDDILIRLKDSEDHVIIEIIDNGFGIPSDEIYSIFEPFQRCSNIRKIHGTGLGLSIVKKGIEKLGGDITITSEINQGTNVIVKLFKREVFHV